ncbi:MAG: hypothetical protein HYW63_02330 [Candidatus Levybacteria bacterium]|nr:hypothetical protein [Candidatus Levybacteria bacterium]
MAEKTDQQKTERKKFHLEFVKQLLTLSTAGFGLAAALAWNSLIQQILNEYVKSRLGEGVIFSGFLYAIIVTLVAVLVTLQLSKIVRRLEGKN